MCIHFFLTVRLFAVRLFAVPTYLSKASAIVKSSCAAFRQLWDFDLFCNLIHGHMPCMKFLFVRSDVCRQLPSDSTSRWTPLLLAMQFPLLGFARDFHPLDNAHAERTE